MMQELERGDSGVRSTASVQGSLVMFPDSCVWFGRNENKNASQIGKWRMAWAVLVLQNPIMVLIRGEC